VNRLDELFREDNLPVEAVNPKSQEPTASGAQKIVLSIDWEITPQALESFLDQVRLLKGVYQADKVVIMFLQILGSLGQYIKSSRSKVHPSTFTLLNSVFARLERSSPPRACPSPPNANCCRPKWPLISSCGRKSRSARRRPPPPHGSGACGAGGARRFCFHSGDSSDVGSGDHGAQGVHPLGDESAAAANENRRAAVRMHPSMLRELGG